jgi:hypothetical protein
VPTSAEKTGGSNIPFHYVSISRFVQLDRVAVYKSRLFRPGDMIPENPPDGTTGFVALNDRNHTEPEIVYSAKNLQWILVDRGGTRSRVDAFINLRIVDQLRLKLGISGSQDDVPSFSA